MNTRNYDHLFKLLLIGESCVGKSAIIKRFAEDKFAATATSTVGVDFLIKNLSIPESGKVVKLQIWDTAGQERYQLITPIFYRGANAIILVYDVTDTAALAGIRKWHDEAMKLVSKDSVQFIIIGNKNDMQKDKKISTREGLEFARSLDVNLFFETSAKTGSGIENTFSKITAELIKRDIAIPKEKPSSSEAELPKDNRECSLISCPKPYCAIM